MDTKLASTPDIEEQQLLQRSAILKVYNYYRVFIASVLLLLFLEPETQLVGNVDPDLFNATILLYLAANILIVVFSLFDHKDALAKTIPSFIILAMDIVCLVLLMSASGGVSSGLGNFLIFASAFGGGLIVGRISTVLPAIAFILTIYDEIYLFFLDINTLQSFFNAGLLGIALFLANTLIQYLNRQLRAKEGEVVALGQINQMVIERMKMGIVVVSEDGEIRLINKSAELLLATPNVDGKLLKTLPYTLKDRLSEWKQASTRQSVIFHTYESGRELLANFSALTGDRNSDTLVFLEDSSEIQQQAQQLKLAAVGRLSASIAHEIRNPLGAISHAAQLLGESEFLDKEDLRLTEIIQNHTIRMNRVIENVLHLSRRKNAEPQQIDLKDWLDQFAIEFSTGMQDQPEIDIAVDPADMAVDVDPGHLGQVLGNLCQNGLRYSSQHTGESKVKLAAGIEFVSGNAFLDVVDYGPGIEDELVQNLFEPFCTTESTGTGLGLYLSKELREANHARLSYNRAATGGSCFRISFLE